jgi:hypothetical protein
MIFDIKIISKTQNLMPDAECQEKTLGCWERRYVPFSQLFDNSNNAHQVRCELAVPILPESRLGAGNWKPKVFVDDFFAAAKKLAKKYWARAGFHLFFTTAFLVLFW